MGDAEWILQLLKGRKVGESQRHKTGRRFGSKQICTNMGTKSMMSTVSVQNSSTAKLKSYDILEEITAVKL